VAGSTSELITQAVGRMQAEVPGLGKLKLVFGLHLPARGDTQIYRVELPGPKVTKGQGDDERLRVTIPRTMFNILASDGELADWHEAYDHGHLKVEGDPRVQRLIGSVIMKREARSHLKKAH
jgi:hypothetical protein